MTPTDDPVTPATSSAPTPPLRPAPVWPAPSQPTAPARPDAEAPAEPDNPQDHQTTPAVYDEPGEIGVPAEAPEPAEDTPAAG